MKPELSIGWIGAGRMGSAMAARLLAAGLDVAVYNRTRAKAEPLAALGARLADAPSDLADRDVVFTNLSSSDVFVDMVCGPNGLLSRKGKAPRLLVDFSTVSAESSAAVRQALSQRGAAMLDAPVSGNAKVVEAGKLSIVASGPAEAFETALPYLRLMAKAATYVGEGEAARIVKICHNVFLGVVAQSLAEVTILAEKGGVPRHAFLDFINNSVMGSMFTRYKAPAYVNLDFKPTFTPVLLRKDLDLGLAAGRAMEVPLPLAAQVREILQSMIGQGYRDCDFAALLEVEAKAAGLSLVSENVDVDPGI
ncbi:6-phosphogluconate dehydrogenase [Paramagnetospirillum caucaseum]|uniref:6-phosphogluconate dehydrogenase n=1 Tax=Paramagnetospirillum caucaseum TaxID=1244869 RepID=M2Z1L5_9PROT|nr:NAD(P)-dependent oxidoreductase [Paramagnetospirillum caucaseum]EME68155.1 6-phosphogluconate dehydrogenase [Paramagnetospirillum caucaseum]